MDDWSEIVRHLEEAFPGTRAGPGDVVAVALGGDDAVEVRRVEARTGMWVQVAGVVGSSRHASPVELLASNVMLTVGGFALHEGTLILRQSLPVRGLTAAVLAETLRAIAIQARRARRHLAELALG